MTTATKAAGRGAAPTAYKITPSRNYSPIQSFVKAVTVSLAIRALLAYAAADWIIRRGGLRHA